MRACNKNAVPNTGSVRRNRRGFTLVELIVVLTILVILASIGVASVVGYIRYSRFEQNQENAVSVYQAAQTALSQKVANGSIEEWSQGIAASNGITFPSVTNADETYSELVALSYFPADSGTELYDLLSGYLYDVSVSRDASLFRGSMTVVINLTVTGRGEGVDPYYSAGVVGAFYSLQNQGNGWDSSYINTSEGRGDVAPWNTLPCTQYKFRRDKSFVGFFDGTEASVIGPRGVAPVVLPMSVAPPTPVNHVVGPSVDPNADTSGYLFNLRNGETLDLTWAIFDVGPQILQSSRHNENITITLYNVDVPDEGSNPPYAVYDTFTINASSLPEFNSASTNVVHETVNGIYNVTKTSCQASVSVISTRFPSGITLPLTITKVEGDTRRDCPAGDENYVAFSDSIYYYSYSISLDYMMVRSLDGVTRYADKPLNLSATIQGTAEYLEGDPAQPITTTRSIPETYATRDMNDPVYRRDVSHMTNTSYLTCSYLVENGVAPKDQEDITDEYTGDPISGRCVVNTLFGDKGYDAGNLGSAKTTDLDSSGGEAVITAYRHLYNIRRINSLNYGATHYLIISDIDWYWHIDNYYASEVRVYNGTTGRSPVEGGALHIVSFPALQELRSVDSLSSLSRVGSNIYSINNVQMRVASFRIGSEGDAGYGLICKNQGTVYNIYTNNLNLVLEKVEDGSESDYSLINSNEPVTISSGASRHLSQVPVGGLIGLNTSQIGSSGYSDAESYNTIVMNNCVVMAGQYWRYADYVNGSSGVGGVVGYSADGSSIYGVIRTGGSFAVIGDRHVGGIIGQFNKDENNKNATLYARLVVDGNPSGDSEFSFPVNTITGQPMTCVVASSDIAGGAIGYLTRATLNYSHYQRYSVSSPNTDGRITFGNLPDTAYQFNIRLPQNSLIIRTGNTDWPSVGGAIGNMKMDRGDYTSFNIYNDGWIVSYAPGNTSDNKTVYCGGAIGIDEESTLTDVYINIVNGEHSRISHLLDAGSSCVNSSGGALGYLYHNGGSGVTYAINADNSGLISAYGGEGGKGFSQGAGGAIGGTNINNSANIPSFLISTVNRGSSVIEMPQDVSRDYGWDNGVGGAVGGMNNDKNYSITESSVIFAENFGIIRGCHEVGGTIGRIVTNYGSVYAVNHGTITATEDNVGGVFGGTCSGNNNNKQYGTIQAVLDGATIIGRNFVGGAAGRLLCLMDNASVRTIVRGSSSVTGASLVGGVCGDVQVQDTGTGCDVSLSGDASSPVLTITGSGDGVGGVAGLMRFTVQNSCSVGMPDQSSTDKLVLRVDGKNYVGGAIGALRSTSAGYNNIPSEILSATATSNNVLIDLRVVLHPESHIVGTGDGVGGAIGFMDTDGSKFGGYISVSSSSGSSAGQSYIRGNRYVGGAVGYFKKTLPSVFEGVTAGISVNFSLAPWTIEATVAANSDANVGGAVGYFDGNYGSNGNMFPIDVNLGTTTVKALGPNVGGAVGKSSMRLGIIHVTNLAGLVEGQYNIGGAIGLNQYSFNEATVNVLSSGIIRATGSYGGSGKDAGSNAGGVVGSYSFSANDSATITSNISATISGTVFGTGNNVGGAVGYCYSNKNTHLIRDISVTLQGEAVVQGADNVGGVNGFSQSNITNVSSNISGNSKVIGNIRVGGAIGWTYANDQAAGLDVLYESKDITGYSLSQLESALSRTLYKKSGRIYSITATISADYALQGDMYLGGAVGQSGFKSLEGGNKYSSPALVNVEAVINAGFLFDPFNTGNTGGDACVGGVIGLVVDGRINNVRLSGTGGTVVTDSRYQCPEISMNGAVLIAGYGRSIGGIIGQIGLEGWNSSTGKYIYTGNNAQNVTVSSISASSSLKICVVSMDGSDRIGGWIGSAYGKFGGIGNRTSSDYTNVNTRATYEVNNVRYVYSRGDCVGGFCGLSQAFGTSRETYVIVNVTLTDATVTGRSCVGGAFGKVYGVYFKKGSINVSLNSHTVIGDVNGSTLCYEAGGAIGDLLLNSAGESQTVKLEIPITVSIDNTSHIWAAGGNDDSYTSYGVGGVLGRAYGEFNTAGTIHVSSTDPESVAVYSRYSNVGGAIGLMEKVKMHSYNSNNVSYAENLTVRAEGTNASAGGFAGRIISLEDKMLYCYYRGTGTVISTGSNSDAGGFAGFAYLNGKTLENCYTTAEVNSSGVYTGGFIGNLSYGTINNSYVGGHTYNGAYVAGSGNITGVGNVGGFVGATTGNNTVTINNCYSTASVLGTADNIGGFIGNSSSTTVIKSSYCTGRVNGTYTTTTDDEGNTVYHYPTAGSFAGAVAASNLNNYSSNKVMRLINPVGYPLIGENWTSAIATDAIDYADASAIKGNNNHTGHPYDTAALGSVFGLRAVIGNEHYGDWPLPVTEASIENATVLIYTKIGEDAEGEPVYDWIEFVNGQYETEFNGTAVTLDDILKVQVQGKNLKRDVDYTLSYRSNSKIGTATVIISAKPGNPNGYSGALSRTFRITGADIEGSTITLNEHSREYTGARIEPDVTVVYHGTTLQLNTDYRLAYDRDGDIEQGFDNDNISIGEMYVYVVGINNYEGVKVCDQKFSITAIDLSNLDPADVTLVGADNLVYDEDDAGNPVAHCPGVVVRYGGNTLNGTTDSDESGYDYVISYRNNTQAGTAYLIVTGTADESIGTGSVYTGKYEVEFTITQAVNTWVNTPELEGWTYGATPNTPTGKAKYGEFVCEFYDDISCTADHLISDIRTANAGTYYAKIYVPESDNYRATTPVIVRFTIAPAPITDAVVEIEPNQFDYDGNPHAPEPSTVTVTLNGEPLVNGTDYTISYDEDSTSAGAKTLTVNGNGNYTGTATGTYEIVLKHDVTFNMNGHGDLVAPQRVVDGDLATAPEVADIQGYAFRGWYMDISCQTPYDFSIPVKQDIVLYAKWQETWTVTYVIGSVNFDVVYDAGIVPPLPTPADHPEMEGYTIDGWFTDSTYQSSYTPVAIRDDYTVYARIVYTVTFATGEGATVIDPVQVYAGASVNRPTDDPSRDGYTFSGWYADPEYGTTYDFALPVTDNISIYAKWDVITPTPEPTEGG